MSLAPVVIGMVGLEFALWANGVQLLGVDDKPATEDGPSPGLSVAVAGSAMGALTLLFMSIWLVAAAPLGTEGEAVKLGLLFSAISGMYGLLWLGAAVVQARGWDLRPIGNLALLCLGLQVIEMGLLASYRSGAGISTAHFLLTEAALACYVLVLYGFWALTHERITARPVGLFCIIAVVGTLYIMIYGGGLLTPPGA